MRVALPKLFFWHVAEDAMHRVVFSQVKRKSDGIVCLVFAPFTEVRGQLNDGSLVQGSNWLSANVSRHSTLSSLRGIEKRRK